jgi:hypothetical protein
MGHQVSKVDYLSKAGSPKVHYSVLLKGIVSQRVVVLWCWWYKHKYIEVDNTGCFHVRKASSYDISDHWLQSCEINWAHTESMNIWAGQGPRSLVVALSAPYKSWSKTNLVVKISSWKRQSAYFIQIPVPLEVLYIIQNLQYPLLFAYQASCKKCYRGASPGRDIWVSRTTVTFPIFNMFFAEIAENSGGRFEKLWLKPDLGRCTYFWMGDCPTLNPSVLYGKFVFVITFRKNFEDLKWSTKTPPWILYNLRENQVLKLNIGKVTIILDTKRILPADAPLC